jgi:hypothetical protein
MVNKWRISEMNTHHRHKRSTADLIGQGVFYLGFIAGICFSASLLYLDMKEMDKGMFDALAADSGITLSLIAVFLIPLGLGWSVKLMISGRRYQE